VAKGSAVRFTCPQLDEDAMHAWVLTEISKARTTARAQRELARTGKRQSAAIASNPASSFELPLQQSSAVEEFGLGGAAAGAPARAAEGAAAALQDDGASRPVSRMLSAFVADSAAQTGGGPSQPPPGTLETLDVASGRQAVFEAMAAAMSKRPRYSVATRKSMQRRASEVGLQAAKGGEASEGTLGSANPFFGVNSTSLKRAAVRYVQLPDGAVLNQVKQAMDEFFVEKAFHGGSVTSQEFTTAEVCTELMACAERAGLTLPSVLEKLRQFVKEMRRGDSGLQPFFKTSKSVCPGRKPAGVQIVE